MSDTQEHPDWFRAHDGKWYPKDRLPAGDHVADPTPPRNPDRRPWLLVAAGLGILAAVLVFSFTRGADDEEPEVAAPTPTVAAPTTEPTTVLDEVFPDRPETESTEQPTPDAAAATAAADDLQITEASWVRSAFDELDFAVVVTNGADVAYANVNLDAVFVDDTGAELGRVPFSYPLVGAGSDVILSGLRPIDPDAVADVRLEASARGSLPPAPPAVEVTDWTWEQDAAGTVTVSGSIVATRPTEFVSVVAVLRDADGAFLGTAFAFVDAVVDAPRTFEAIGFPLGDVADADLHLNG